MEPLNTVVAYYLCGVSAVLLILCYIGYRKNWKGKDENEVLK